MPQRILYPAEAERFAQFAADFAGWDFDESPDARLWVPAWVDESHPGLVALARLAVGDRLVVVGELECDSIIGWSIDGNPAGIVVPGEILVGS